MDRHRVTLKILPKYLYHSLYNSVTSITFEMTETQLIRDFFTDRRRRCLSVNQIEKEAEIPAKTLWFALEGVREIPYHHLDVLIQVLVDFGYKPLDRENKQSN